MDNIPACHPSNAFQDGTGILGLALEERQLVASEITADIGK